MQTGDRPAERLEMAAMKKGNRTLVADDINTCIPQIDCLCKWHVVNFYLVIVNRRHHVVASLIGHQPDSYTDSSVQIHLLTCTVKQR
jgi:hypothetical protein